MERTICKRLAVAAGLAALVGVGTAPAAAAVITSGCDSAADTLFGASCSLAELAAGGTLQVADKLFSSFALSAFSGRAIDAGLIRVDPIDSPNDPGFALVDVDGTLRAEDGDSSATNLDFNVAIAGGPKRILGFEVTLGVGEVAGDDSFASMFATLFTTDFSTVLGNSLLVCDTLVPTPCGGTSASESGSFDSLDALAVTSGFDVFSGIAGVAQIESISFRFAQIPAPGSLALVGLGLAGLAGWRRRGA